jgi:hypothetical protein
MAASLLGVTGALIAGVAVVAARGIGDPGLGSDLSISVWIGLLAGVSYGWFLGLGACLGRRGGGRLGSLALDWFLGTGTGALAAVWPRGHLRNLLGAEPVLGLSQGAAMATLTALAVICLAMALWRTPR